MVVHGIRSQGGHIRAALSPCRACPASRSPAGRWAGFILVRTEGVNDMSEFFVMRKYRRSGTGREAARRVFALFPGAWQVRQLHGNDAATAFWRAVVPSGYEETVTGEGPVQRFTILR